MFGKIEKKKGQKRKKSTSIECWRSKICRSSQKWSPILKLATPTNQILAQRIYQRVDFRFLHRYSSFLNSNDSERVDPPCSYSVPRVELQRSYSAIMKVSILFNITTVRNIICCWEHRIALALCIHHAETADIHM